MRINGVMPAGLMLLFLPAGFWLGRSAGWMMLDTEKGICTEADLGQGNVWRKCQGKKDQRPWEQ